MVSDLLKTFQQFQLKNSQRLNVQRPHTSNTSPDLLNKLWELSMFIDRIKNNMGHPTLPCLKNLWKGQFWSNPEVDPPILGQSKKLGLNPLTYSKTDRRKSCLLLSEVKDLRKHHQGTRALFWSNQLLRPTLKEDLTWKPLMIKMPQLLSNNNLRSLKLNLIRIWLTLLEISLNRFWRLKVVLNY
jgi:hypothetical protein